MPLARTSSANWLLMQQDRILRIISPNLLTLETDVGGVFWADLADPGDPRSHARPRADHRYSNPGA